MNPATERYCRSCHHEAHVARLDCQCPRCVTARHRAATVGPPVPIPAAIAAAIAALRSRVDAPDLPTDGPAAIEGESIMPRKNNNAPNDAPVTREVKRTPVSADLAEKIRALDETLLATYGFDLCYAIWAREGLIAASNAKDGYVTPLVAPAVPDGGK
jgi:hypothetical protein